MKWRFQRRIDLMPTILCRMYHVPEDRQLRLLAYHIRLCPILVNVSTWVVACHAHTTWHKKTPQLQVSCKACSIQFRHECSIQIQCFVHVFSALIVHPLYCLLQFLVVKLGGSVPTFTAILIWREGCQYRQASKRLQCCYCYFSHSETMYSFQVGRKLVD